jgi:hypothetical protein
VLSLPTYVKIFQRGNDSADGAQEAKVKERTLILILAFMSGGLGVDSVPVIAMVKRSGGPK